MNKVNIKGKTFEKFLEEEVIQGKVKEMARHIENDNRGKNILFLGILNGAYVFAADLLRNIGMNVNLSFIKLASYEGLKSSGEIKRLIGLNEELANKTVIILEDIVDTGKTLEEALQYIKAQGAEDIKVAALMLKTEAYMGSYNIDYLGFEIPNDFVIGYGLDFDGLGRNLRSVYRIAGNDN
ncbi:MAG: hypoxanthine phosphoribosyltransferase [Bacteroidota bacterium]